MSTHFTQDEFVLAYYGEREIDARREHLDACDECRAELARLAQRPRSGHAGRSPGAG